LILTRRVAPSSSWGEREDRLRQWATCERGTGRETGCGQRGRSTSNHEAKRDLPGTLEGWLLTEAASSGSVVVPTMLAIAIPPAFEGLNRIKAVDSAIIENKKRVNK
jgi:hypothetical protein